VGELGKRVLVADDDEGVRRLLEEVLRRAGYRVEVCRDGSEAFKRLGSGTYDLLVFDHHMPKVTGLNLARMARLAGMAVPILLITSALEVQAEAQLHELDGLQVILKPFGIEDFLLRVERLLGGSSEEEQNTPPTGTKRVT